MNARQARELDLYGHLALPTYVFRNLPIEICRQVASYLHHPITLVRDYLTWQHHYISLRVNSAYNNLTLTLHSDSNYCKDVDTLYRMHKFLRRFPTACAVVAVKWSRDTHFMDGTCATPPYFRQLRDILHHNRVRHKRVVVAYARNYSGI